MFGKMYYNMNTSTFCFRVYVIAKYNEWLNSLADRLFVAFKVEKLGKKIFFHTVNQDIYLKSPAPNRK